MLYNFIRFCVFCFLRIFFRLEIQGIHNIPRQGAFILASNHVSNLDPLVVGILPRGKIYFLAKEELFSPAPWGACLRFVGAVPLKRGRADLGAMKTAVMCLKNGRPLVIFPQGGRGKEKAKPGVGFLYKKSGVPLILAKVEGTDKVLPKGKKWCSFGRIRVIIQKAESIDKTQNPQDISTQILEHIKRIVYH
ncbi:MAG: 1-acyl-sn-glycerol-3-phosphate acyltransferase [Candidatus Omnitrophica bacterium]|nr:1-acyl-sn-glycerol-3-phosphate acyltransferase [Candidatus Omnitrophota bacterium]